MKLTHPCAIPDCPTELTGRKELCNAHYGLVPQPLRKAMAVNARKMDRGGEGAAQAYEKALNGAIRFVLGQPPTRKQPTALDPHPSPAQARERIEALVAAGEDAKRE